MAAKAIEVVPDGANWKVIRQGDPKPLSIHATKEPAIKAGREQAKKDKAEFIVKDKNGKIIEKDSYGNDPNPPKDKNN